MWSLNGHSGNWTGRKARRYEGLVQHGKLAGGIKPNPETVLTMFQASEHWIYVEVSRKVEKFPVLMQANFDEVGGSPCTICSTDSETSHHDFSR